MNDSAHQHSAADDIHTDADNIHTEVKREEPLTWVEPDVATGRLQHWDRKVRSLLKFLDSSTRVGLGPEDILVQARAWASLFEMGKASEAYRRALRDKSLRNNAGVLREYGDVLVTLAQIDEAVEQYDASLKLVDDHATRTNRATALAKLGRLPDAMADLLKVLDENPLAASALNNLALLLQQSGDLTGALTQLDKGIEASPQDKVLRSNRAAVLVELERKEDALADIDAILEKHPDDVIAWIHRGILLRNLDKLEEALIALNHAVELDPRNVRARNNRGHTFDVLGRLVEAQADFKAAEALDDDDAHTLGHIGHNLALQGKLEEALEYLSRALAISPDDVEVLLMLGEVKSRTGDLEGALTDLQLGLDKEPRNADILAEMARILVDSNRHDEALGKLDLVLDITPRDHSAQYNKAAILGNTGLHEESLEAFREALEFRPGDMATQIAVGSELVALERSREAAEVLADVTNRLSEVPSSSLHKLGAVLLGIPDFATALSVFQRMAELSSDRADALVHQVECLLPLGLLDEARSILGELLADESDNTTVLALSGALELLSDRPQEARKVFERAALLGPELKGFLQDGYLGQFLNADQLTLVESWLA